MCRPGGAKGQKSFFRKRSRPSFSACKLGFDYYGILYQVYIRKYKVLRSAGGAHEEEKNNMRIKQTERFTILGANCRFVNAMSSMLEDTDPNAACTCPVRNI